VWLWGPKSRSGAYWKVKESSSATCILGSNVTVRHLVCTTVLSQDALLITVVSGIVVEKQDNSLSFWFQVISLKQPSNRGSSNAVMLSQSVWLRQLPGSIW
jgi:hypothetical protein